jgi:hypothetical protein
MAFDPSTAELSELVKWTGNAEPGSKVHTRGSAELIRRQMVSAIDATEAQKKAADAARANANYMLASVIVAAVAAIFSAISAVATLYSIVPHK